MMNRNGTTGPIQSPQAVASPSSRKDKKWNVFYDKEQQRFFYADSETKEVTWTRPPDFDRDLERKTYIFYKITLELGSNETPSHEIASAILRHLTSFNVNDYLYNYFNLPVETLENLIQDRCSFMFRSLLDEKMAEQDEHKRLKGNASYEAATKLLQTDKRFGIVKPSERKAIFNNWRLTAAEREAAIKKAYFDHTFSMFFDVLHKSPKFRPDMTYHQAVEAFSADPFWRLFGDYERKKAFEMCKRKIVDDKKQQEEETRRKNMEALASLLVSMPEVNYATTWALTQKLLLENEAFKKNKELLKMDKNDALDVFSNYKKSLQTEYRSQIEKEDIQYVRRDRKIRDSFEAMLIDMRNQGMIKLTTKWKDIFPYINGDKRYDEMCTQPGCTALDFFKFLMEDWREEFARNLQEVRRMFENAKIEFSFNMTREAFIDFVQKQDVERSVKPHNYSFLYEHFIRDSIEKMAINKDSEEDVRSFFQKQLGALESENKLKNIDVVLEEFGFYLGKKDVEKIFLDVYDRYTLNKKVDDASEIEEVRKTSGSREKSQKEEKNREERSDSRDRKRSHKHGKHHKKSRKHRHHSHSSGSDSDRDHRRRSKKSYRDE
uniref:WW domain-containing protein n=1 Tax=Panagrolaimus sp. JU765 TaxID=591449 RepID=A0AC34RJK4_9BILA